MNDLYKLLQGNVLFVPYFAILIYQSPYKMTKYYIWPQNTPITKKNRGNRVDDCPVVNTLTDRRTSLFYDMWGVYMWQISRSLLLMNRFLI